MGQTLDQPKFQPNVIARLHLFSADYKSLAIPEPSLSCRFYDSALIPKCVWI